MLTDVETNFIHPDCMAHEPERCSYYLTDVAILQAAGNGEREREREKRKWIYIYIFLLFFFDDNRSDDDIRLDRLPSYLTIQWLWASWCCARYR